MTALSSPKRYGKWALSLGKLREFWCQGKTTMMVSGQISTLYPTKTKSLKMWDEVYGK